MDFETFEEQYLAANDTLTASVICIIVPWLFSFGCLFCMLMGDNNIECSDIGEIDVGDAIKENLNDWATIFEKFE